MSQPLIGTLTPVPALSRPDLLAAPVLATLTSWEHRDGVSVVEIDSELADTAAMTAAYDVPLTVSANCVVVAGRREGEERLAACVVRADSRADVNNVVKRLLDVRKASFLAMERAVAEAEMEYGGITPIGLPPRWRLLVAAEVADLPLAVVGSGVRRSKLALPGELLARLPGAEVVSDLAIFRSS